MNRSTFVRTLELQWRQAVVEQVLSRAMIANSTFSVTEPAYIVDAIVVQMSTFLLAAAPKHVEVRYPRDWREAVKARFAPAWALRRWPVVETVRVIDIEAQYPDCGLKIRDYGKPHFVVKLDNQRLTVN